MPRNMDVESDDERTVCPVAYEAKCRETMINMPRNPQGYP